MSHQSRPLIVAGIDVGGAKKGFHAVALKDGRYLARFSSKGIAELTEWCRLTVRAHVIAIDAPCRWSQDGKARPAERELMRQKVWCFSTPTRERALNHPTNHHGLMLRGEELFRAFEATHALAGKTPWLKAERKCFETFPHAIRGHVAILPEVQSASSSYTGQEYLRLYPIAQKATLLRRNLNIHNQQVPTRVLHFDHWIANGHP